MHACTASSIPWAASASSRGPGTSHACRHHNGAVGCLDPSDDALDIDQLAIAESVEGVVVKST